MDVASDIGLASGTGYAFMLQGGMMAVPERLFLGQWQNSLCPDRNAAGKRRLCSAHAACHNSVYS